MMRIQENGSMGNTAFITGATGFLGAAIARALKAAGHEVRALCCGRDSAARVSALGYTPVLGRLEAAGPWLDSVREAQVVVHAAQTRPGMRLSSGWLKRSRAVRNLGLELMFTAARDGDRCRSFIYTSGIAAAGDHGEEWIDEDSPRRDSAMGDYHHEGERLVLDAAQSGLPACVLRPGFVYGADGSFRKFFLAEAEKGVYRYPGDGRNYISWVHAEDMARGYVAAAQQPPVGRVLHLVDDRPLRMDEFASELLNAFGGGRAQRVPRFLVALLAGGPLAEMLTGSYRVRNGRAKEILGWQPLFPTFAQGIVDVVQAYQGRASPSATLRTGASNG